MGMCCSKFGGSYLIKKEDGNVTKNGAGATPKITKVDTIIDNGLHYLKLFFYCSVQFEKIELFKMNSISFAAGKEAIFCCNGKRIKWRRSRASKWRNYRNCFQWKWNGC